MKNMIRLTDYSAKDIADIFSLVDEISDRKYSNALMDKNSCDVLSNKQHQDENNLIQLD
ncbi:MAG: hypothetical protein HUJ68_11385 [Clostridia bacterium]|nr:hypothetical protein [Clostridia bacterium]